MSECVKCPFNLPKEHTFTVQAKKKKKETVFVLFEKPITLSQFEKIQDLLFLDITEHIEFDCSFAVMCNFQKGGSKDKKEKAYSTCHSWYNDFRKTNYNKIVVSGEESLKQVISVLDPDSPTPKDILTEGSFVSICKNATQMPYEISIFNRKVELYIIPHYYNIITYFSLFGGEQQTYNVVRSSMEMLVEKFTPPLPYELLDTSDKIKKAKKFFKELLKSKEKRDRYVALDIETYNTNYSSKYNKLRCVGLTAQAKNFILPFAGRYGTPTTSDEVREELIEFLTWLFKQKVFTWIAHNTNFDFTLLSIFFNIFPEGDIEDNMLIAHLMDETQVLTAKALGKLHVPEVPSDYVDLVQSGTSRRSKWETIKNENLYAYCVCDTYEEWRTFFALCNPFRMDKPFDLYKNIVKPLNVILIKGSIHGIPIDTKSALKQLNSAFETTQELEFKMQDYVDNNTKDKYNNFNPNSTPQLSRVLYDEFKFPITKRTKTGNPSVEMDVITELASKYKKHTHIKFLEYYMEFKGLIHLQNNYLTKFINMTDYFGFIHPQFKTAGARETGRVTSADPPFVNLPRTGDLKGLVKAPDGYSFVYADYSQCEYALFAYFIQDPHLMKAIKDGADFHEITAKAMFGPLYDRAVMAKEQAELYKGDIKDWENMQTIILPEDYDRLSGKLATTAPQDLQKELRTVSKSCNFGIIYGAKPQTTADSVGVPVEEVELFLKQLFNKFPNIEKFLTVVPKSAETRGYLITPFGRRKWFKGEFDNHMRNQALNIIFQSGAQDVLSRTIIRIDRKFKEDDIDGRFVNCVYDSFLELIADKDLEKGVDNIKKILKIPIPEFGHLVLNADLGVGKTWKEAESNATKI